MADSPNSADAAPAYVPAAPKVNSSDPKKIEEVPLEIGVPKKDDSSKKKEAKAAEAPKPGEQDGFDVTRPFRYGWAFISGTVGDTLDGIATGGRNGFWIGIAIGIFLCIGGGIAAPALVVMASSIALCSVAGILLGGVAGLISGGVNGMTDEAHRDGSDKPVQKAPARGIGIAKPRSQGLSFAEYDAVQDKREEIMYDRMQQQAAENRADDKTYWQDSVADRMSWMKGR